MSIILWTIYWHNLPSLLEKVNQIFSWTSFKNRFHHYDHRKRQKCPHLRQKKTAVKSYETSATSFSFLWSIFSSIRTVSSNIVGESLSSIPEKYGSEKDPYFDIFYITSDLEISHYSLPLSNLVFKSENLPKSIYKNYILLSYLKMSFKLESSFTTKTCTIFNF